MANQFKSVIILSLSLALLPLSAAQAHENYLFNFTHMLPSPYSLPAGRLVFGTGLGYGVTDFLDIGTNLLRDFYQVYNAEAKLSFLDYPEFAGAFTLGWSSYNFHDVSTSNPDRKITTYQPGAVAAFSIAPPVAWFVGGHYDITNQTLNKDGIKTSGYIEGIEAESDLSWAYNPSTKGKQKSYNVLSAGITYDFTYNLFGIGISHHWLGFHLGIHYYPNADQYKVLPIIAGGGVIDL